MTFRQAVHGTPHLGGNAFHAGIQALKAIDRSRIACAKTSNLSGSVDVDVALKQILPNSPRWDYAIGYRQKAEVVYWVEVHPASLGNIAEVQSKLQWLKGWLAGDGYKLRRLDARFIWVSSGRTTLTAGSPAVRKLAQQGVQVVGRVLRIE